MGFLSAGSDERNQTSEQWLAHAASVATWEARLHPPQTEVPGALPLTAILGRSADVVVAVDTTNERLMLSVGYPDGRLAANLVEGFALHRREPTGDPFLASLGGCSGEYSADVTYWLWPLPPPGDLDLVCAWPQRGIPETHLVIPAELLAAAAAQVVDPWT